MAVNEENIQYYSNNVLRAITNWNLLSNAVVSGETVVINSGGSAGYDLANTYNNGLKASSYRSLDVVIAMDINQQYNYENYVDIVLKGTYTDSDNKKLKSYQSISVTYLKSAIASGVVTLSRIITMPNFDYTTLTIYVVNHTTGKITLQSCSMKRSQDISGSQVGESIGWGIALNKVIGYLDGCEVYYDGEEKPLKMWWQGEGTDFTGVNVNNERLIKFSRKNEVLLD